MMIKKLIAGWLSMVLCMGVAQAQLDSMFVLEKIIARVDNHIILLSELEIAAQQAMQQGEANTQELRCRVLESLIIDKMLLAQAESDSVVVDEEAVDRELDRRMSYFVALVGGDETKLEKYYGKTIDQLKGEMRLQVREQLVSDKMQNTVLSDVVVTPGDVKDFYATIPKDSLPYISREVEIGYIVKTPFAQQSQKNEARNRLVEIKKKIVSGESDFITMAKMYSEDLATRPRGGDIGWLNLGDVMPEYESAALRLKPGEISDVVETPVGYYLIMMIEKAGNKYHPRHILIRPAAMNQNQAAIMWLDSVKNDIEKGKIDFNKTAKLYSEDKTTSLNGGMVQDQYTGSLRVPLEMLDIITKRVLDTMEVGEVSSPIPFTMPDGSVAYRIIYYKANHPPHITNLKDDYSRVSKAALEEKKDRVLMEWVKKMKSELFIDIAPEYKNCVDF